MSDFQFTVKLYTAHPHITAQILNIQFRIFHLLPHQSLEAGNEVLVKFADRFFLYRLVITEKLFQLFVVGYKISDARKQQLRIERLDM